MFKKIWFQTHWLLGITAGIVLAVIGVTGASLSFQNQILRALNPGVVSIAEPGERGLTPAELFARVQAAAPDKKMISLTVSSDPHDAARVSFAGGNGPRGETRYVDPYTGALLSHGALRGESTLRLLDQIHRRLAAGEVGKQITGASTLVLVVLALSGLYLRWPRSAGNWRKWLTLDWARKGRGFLWDLHAVAGTWALVFYLCAALTGLTWSYDGYRGALYALAGAEMPQRGGAGGNAQNRQAQNRQADNGQRGERGERADNRGGPALAGDAPAGERMGRRGESADGQSSERMSDTGARTGERREQAGQRADDRGGERGAQRGESAIDGEAPAQERGRQAGERMRESRSGRDNAKGAAAINLETVWVAFRNQVGAFSTATLRLPERAGEPVQVSYLDIDPPHERAFNRFNIDPASGAISKLQRYADKKTGEKLVASIYPLHAGSFFGVTGSLLMMIASLGMPLFAITGWMLYLERRGKQRAARNAAKAAKAAATTPSGGETILIGYASQSGLAAQLAWQTASSLQHAGMTVAVRNLGTLEPAVLGQFRRALFLVSTFGEGEAPDSARGFFRKLNTMALPELQFGLLALGDRQYSTFCGSGRLLAKWLRDRGAAPLFETIEVDRGNADALRDWQHRVNELSGADNASAWETETPWQNWRLAQRRLLNPDSAGGPAFHVELESVDGAKADWQSGDLVEILAHHSTERVQQFLAAIKLNGDRRVAHGGGEIHLAELLSLSLLPDPATLPAQIGAQQLADSLHALAPRQYSIASLPEDGRVQLLVRQARHPAADNGDDGELGLASGWLTAHATPGDAIALRLRKHSGFHLADDARPLLLIGNGTGLAGLRAHLKARVKSGHKRNWLIFGERNAAQDFHYREDIENWQSAGFIERLDLAFSRDQEQRRYVQHCVQESAQLLREWIAAGAAIYVCGSLEGMAPAVDRELADILGARQLEQLAAEGRYRRDVY